MVNTSALITASASAFPATFNQSQVWEGFFAAHFANRRSARLAFSASGIEQRHAVVNPLAEDITEWSTARRMERYAVEAMPLGKEALSRALDNAGLAASELGLLAVASCTGYATPGIDVRLARDLAMSPELKRLFIGHVGCHAALPALEAVRDFVLVQGRPAALLCLELPSLHLQRASEELEQAVVHALFSDGACALVLEPATAGRRGLEVLDVAARSDTATSSYMGWDIGDRGFTMTLSHRVPEVLAAEVAPLVDGLLARNGLARGDVTSWAVHPGGPRILDVVGERLGLSEGDLAPSREVLRRHGNCSSPTVLIVLEELARTAPTPTGGHIVMLAFGPGLTLYGALLRAR
jgi:predicted naringenin-chalcone synthase